jgi:hypothetical protein
MHSDAGSIPAEIEALPELRITQFQTAAATIDKSVSHGGPVARFVVMRACPGSPAYPTESFGNRNER